MKKLFAILMIALLMSSSAVIFAKEDNSPIIRKTVSVVTDKNGETCTGEIITYKPYYGPILKEEKELEIAKVLYQLQRNPMKEAEPLKKEFFSYIRPESTGDSYYIDKLINGYRFVGELPKTRWKYSKDGINYYDYCGWITGYRPDVLQPYFDKVRK